MGGFVTAVVTATTLPLQEPPPRAEVDVQLVGMTIILVAIFVAVVLLTRKPRGQRPTEGETPKRPHLPDSWWNP